MLFTGSWSTLKPTEGVLMQINIDKKTGVLLGIIAALVLVIGGLAFTRDDHDDYMGMRNNGIGMNDGMGMGRNSAKYTGADVMFLQMMIPHHQQAVDMSELALKTTKDSGLIALATKIRDAQSAEIVQMKAWLKADGASEDPGHEMGHGMGGMLSDSEMSALTSATGKTFVKLWLQGMIGHHEGAIHMTQMIDSANDPDLKAFGKNVIKVQTAEIAEMKAMLSRLN